MRRPRAGDRVDSGVYHEMDDGVHVGVVGGLPPLIRHPRGVALMRARRKG
jgi:hypothetical protein